MKVISKVPLFKLQPLRIQSCWEVSYNTLLELNPKEIEFEETQKWFNFTEDLLQLKHKNYNILLDVGWYPEADPNGVYGLELIKDYNWDAPLVTFDTNDLTELVEEIEMLVWKVGEGYFN